ncbi:hypothetical protein MJO29_000303 [Puccinia striiformis f. sp. tritici]|nr:hypothetical protein MJO29_000303 [Puccinia striiformis f. sp. tritici]
MEELMYEPLEDMNQLVRFLLPPLYRLYIITKNRAKLSKEDLNRYKTQSQIIKQVISKFGDPKWDLEEKSGGANFNICQKGVIDLLTKMQDCGVFGEMVYATQNNV